VTNNITNAFFKAPFHLEMGITQQSFPVTLIVTPPPDGSHGQFLLWIYWMIFECETIERTPRTLSQSFSEPFIFLVDGDDWDIIILFGGGRGGGEVG
jgi:hypothetical protein